MTDPKTPLDASNQVLRGRFYLWRVPLFVAMGSIVTVLLLGLYFNDRVNQSDQKLRDADKTAKANRNRIGVLEDTLKEHSIPSPPQSATTSTTATTVVIRRSSTATTVRRTTPTSGSPPTPPTTQRPAPPTTAGTTTSTTSRPTPPTTHLVCVTGTCLGRND